MPDREVGAQEEGSSRMSDGGNRSVALVTGSSRGIGAATALELAARGFDLVLTARDAAALETTAKVVRGAGARCTVQVADVTDERSPTVLVGAALEHFGRLDVLVNNAGIAPEQRFLTMEDADVDNVLAVNLRSTIRITKAGAAQMSQQDTGGRIINVVSTFATTSRPGFSMYTASKAGLVGLTRALAVELAREGVVVNAVAPGHVDTDMTARAKADERLYSRLMMDIPQRRFGTADEVARCIAFFADDAPEYVTGEVLRVDGGYLSW